MPRSSRSRSAARALVALAVSGGALAWFLSGVEWAPLQAALAAVELGWVALASLLLLGEFVLRAVRWRVLLRPLGTEARTVDLFAAQVIGAAANTLLPLRAGEVAKPVVAARRAQAPLPAVVASQLTARERALLAWLRQLSEHGELARWLSPSEDA